MIDYIDEGTTVLKDNEPKFITDHGAVLYPLKKKIFYNKLMKEQVKADIRELLWNNDEAIKYDMINLFSGGSQLVPDIRYKGDHVFFIGYLNLREDWEEINEIF